MTLTLGVLDGGVGIADPDRVNDDPMPRSGFAIYLASKDGYKDSVLHTGHFAGAPDDALDTACGLYLDDPTAWA